MANYFSVAFKLRLFDLRLRQIRFPAADYRGILRLFACSPSQAPVLEHRCRCRDRRALLLIVGASARPYPLRRHRFLSTEPWHGP